MQVDAFLGGDKDQLESGVRTRRVGLGLIAASAAALIQVFVFSSVVVLGGSLECLLEKIRILGLGARARKRLLVCIDVLCETSSDFCVLDFQSRTR